MKKKTIYAINDLAFILVILSTLMDDFVGIPYAGGEYVLGVYFY